tara:strand:+ start:56 stop:505 length:450 start_codon:yes stop_codon:yes gene_type:complete
MTDFYTKLKDDLNAVETDYPMRWVGSSYGNDACGSVTLNICDTSETYVQLFAFEFPEEAIAEELTQFSITTFINGEPNYTAWEGNDYQEAVDCAVEYAKAIWKEWVPVIIDEDDGFEHEGQWITDRTKSPCGRFDLTEEESNKLYGPAK